MMMWLDARSSKSLTLLVIMDEGIIDHSYQIKNILPLALKYENEVFGNKWIFEQDGANQRCPQGRAEPALSCVLPCSGQDTGQISRNTRCPGQGRFETWTGQVRTGWCPHALEIL